MKKRILVVEDDENVRITLELLLTQAGFAVTSSSTGKDIFELINIKQPDLILLDVLLGELDGRDLCRAIKTDPKTVDIPVIMISSIYDIYNIILDEKANDVIPKPFTEEVLLSRVQRHLATAC